MPIIRRAPRYFVKRTKTAPLFQDATETLTGVKSVGKSKIEGVIVDEPGTPISDIVILNAGTKGIGKVGDLSTTVPFAYGPGANEPGGLLTFLDWSPSLHGKDANNALGSGTGAGFTSTAAWLDDAIVHVIADATAPTGSAIRQEWPAGDQGTTQGLHHWTWTGHTPDSTLYPGWGGAIGTLQELYVRVHYKFSNPWTNNPNNAKYVGFTMAESGSLNLDMYINDDNTDNQVRWQLQNDGGTANANHRALNGELGAAPHGSWFEMEWYVVCQSLPGQLDGRFRYWRNGTESNSWQQISGPAHNGTNLQFVANTSPGTGIRRLANFPYFYGGNAVPHAQDDYLDIGGLYLSGTQ